MARPGVAWAADWSQRAPADQTSQDHRILKLRLPIGGFDTSHDSAGTSYSVSLVPMDRGRISTTIDYRLSPRGPIGSVGLERDGDGPSIDPEEVNRAAALGPNGPEAKVGMRLSYHF